MKDKEYYQVVSEKFIESWQDLTKVSKPIIAAVNGYAVPAVNWV
jgi:enoyl-CoA hydratase